MKVIRSLRGSATLRRALPPMPVVLTSKESRPPDAAGDDARPLAGGDAAGAV